MESCHSIRRKAERHQVCQLHRGLPRLDKLLENLVVPRQAVHYLSPVGPAHLGQIIIMSDLTFVAAELLVRPAISDPVSAFQTDRHVLLSLFVVHT